MTKDFRNKSISSRASEVNLPYEPDSFTIEELKKAIKEIKDNQEPLGEEFEKILNDNLWELYD